MLTNVEDSFQSLKDEFAFESVYYQVYQEIEGHVFLTVLAYHLLWVIQKTLHEKGIRHNWKTLRESLSGQFIITTTMVNDKGQVINIRHTSEPEPMHVTIYQALGLSLKPLKTVRKIE
jgi:transposase